MRSNSGWFTWLAWSMAILCYNLIALALWFLLELRFPGWYAVWEGDTAVSLALAAALKDADLRLQSSEAAREGDRFLVELDLVEEGVAFADDILCHSREYASIAKLVRDGTGRTVAANRAYLGDNHALVLVRDDRAHVVRMFDPPSRILAFLGDRRRQLGRTLDGSCAPARSSFIKLSSPVSRHPSADHRAGVELTSKP